MNLHFEESLSCAHSGTVSASLYFQEILYIVECTFSLEVLPRYCGGEYVHHRLCLGCRSRLSCGARLCCKARLGRRVSVQHGHAFTMWGESVHPRAIWGAGNTCFLCKEFAL